MAKAKTKAQLEKDLSLYEQTIKDLQAEVEELRRQIMEGVQESPVYRQALKDAAYYKRLAQAKVELNEYHKYVLDNLVKCFYKLDAAQKAKDDDEEDSARRGIDTYAHLMLGYDRDDATHVWIPPKSIDYDKISDILELYRMDPQKVADMLEREHVYDLVFDEKESLREEIKRLNEQITELTAEQKPNGKGKGKGTQDEPQPEQIPNGHRPGARRKYDTATRQHIRDLYKAGNSMASIAAQTGASKTQIHAIIHEQ